MRDAADWPPVGIRTPAGAVVALTHSLLPPRSPAPLVPSLSPSHTGTGHVDPCSPPVDWNWARLTSVHGGGGRIDRQG